MPANPQQSSEPHRITQVPRDDAMELRCDDCPWSVCVPLPSDFEPVVAALKSHPGEAVL